MKRKIYQVGFIQNDSKNKNVGAGSKREAIQIFSQSENLKSSSYIIAKEIKNINFKNAFIACFIK